MKINQRKLKLKGEMFDYKKPDGLRKKQKTKKQRKGLSQKTSSIAIRNKIPNPFKDRNLEKRNLNISQRSKRDLRTPGSFLYAKTGKGWRKKEGKTPRQIGKRILDKKRKHFDSESRNGSTICIKDYENSNHSYFNSKSQKVIFAERPNFSRHSEFAKSNRMITRTNKLTWNKKSGITLKKMFQNKKSKTDDKKTLNRKLKTGSKGIGSKLGSKYLKKKTKGKKLAKKSTKDQDNTSELIKELPVNNSQIFSEMSETEEKIEELQNEMLKSIPKKIMARFEASEIFPENGKTIESLSNETKTQIQEFFQKMGPESWMLTFQTQSDFYCKGERIGKGSFGEVHKAIQLLTGKVVALKEISKKMIRKNKVEERVEERVRKEIRILKEMETHQNVVSLYEVFEDEEKFYLVFEYLPSGDLVNYFKEHALLAEDQLKGFFKEILLGLESIHSKGVIHRDIKPENILLDKDMRPRIADFGISSIFNHLKPIKDTGGTPIYLAPEVIQAEGKVGFKTDVWSSGILLFLLATGTVPFRATRIDDLYERILMCDVEFTEEMDISPELTDLISKMLIKDPDFRISLKDCLQHSWFRNARPWCSVKKRSSLNFQRQFSKIFGEVKPLKSERRAMMFQSQRDINKLRFGTTPSPLPHRTEDFLDLMENGIRDNSTHLTLHDSIDPSKFFNLEQWNQVKKSVASQYLENIGFPQSFITQVLDRKEFHFSYLKACHDALCDLF